jgi:hypothetical protein
MLTRAWIRGGGDGLRGRVLMRQNRQQVLQQKDDDSSSEEVRLHVGLWMLQGDCRHQLVRSCCRAARPGKARQPDPHSSSQTALGGMSHLLNNASPLIVMHHCPLAAPHPTGRFVR